MMSAAIGKILWAWMFPKQAKSDHELKHSALVARRNQLLELINQENNRLKLSWDDDAKKSIREVLELLKKQMKSVDSLLAKMLATDTANQRKIEILQSVKGVGAVTISTLIAELPELGKLNRGEVAKLVTILNLLVKSNQIWQTK